MAILKQDEIKYIGEQIKKTLHSIEHEHYNWIMRHENDPNPYKEEYPGWTEQLIRIRIRDLYFLILAFLESNEMVVLLETFQSNFHTIINDDVKILKHGQQDPEGFDELDVINKFEQFLNPFKFFDYRQKKDEEGLKLTSILKNTDFILKNCNVEVKNEPDIHKQIKWVLGLYYPSCRERNNASFIQEFKSYHPDILIPELKTAIEYKYIKSEEDNLDKFIDQLREDASNYKGDYRYENFIAVIYIENTSVATPDSIELSWKAKEFPNNWELVVVNGSPTKDKTITKIAKKSKNSSR